MRGPAARWARALEHQEHRDARAPGRTWDLRLVPAAVGAWLTGLLGTHLTPAGTAVAAAGYLAALVLAAVLLRTVLLRTVLARTVLVRTNLARSGVHVPTTVRPDRAPHGPPWSSLALSALAMAAVLLSASADRHGSTSGALGEALAGGGTLVVTADVAEGPRPWTAPAAGPAGEDRTGVVLELVLHELTHRGRSGPAEATVTVFADGPAWSALTPGRRITAALVAAGDPAPGPPTLRAAAPPTVLPAAPPTARDRVRQRFVLSTAALGPDAAGLLPGMTFGERSGLGEELEQAMQDTGLTHLTAVSGSNCALVTVLAGHAALVLGARRRTCLLTGLGALGAFVLLVGPDPSVLRAATMGGLAALGLLTGRTAVSLATLSGAVLVLVVLHPALAAEYGFVLSVLATAGIVVTARPLTRWLGRWMPDALALTVAVPATAQLWCAPVLVLLQPAVPVYALVANVVAAPVVPAVTVCGLAGLLALHLPAGDTAALLPLTVGGWGTQLIAGTARTLAAAPGALAPWPDGVPGAVLMAAASAAAVGAVHLLDVRRRRPRPVAGALRGGPAPPALPEQHWRDRDRRRRRRRTVTAALLLLLLAVLALRAVTDARRPAPPWEAVLCDVGQGDAVLLRTAPGRAVLVDTGPDPRALQRCLEDSGVEHLDLLVLTHAHADHTGGLAAVARLGGAAEVWYGTADPDPPPELGEDLPGVAAHRPPPGQTRTVGGLRLTVLAPPAAPRRWGGASSAEENNASLVLRAELTGADGSATSWLLAGDLEEQGARSLLRSAGAQLDVDVLKVSHHGARNGGTAIIDAATPALAVVSVGRDNDYGHPHPQILGHLRDAGVPLVRTDQHGSVRLLREGARLRALPVDG
ncbi:ComEC/Rec2 family competence protein [Kocuria oceani]|uniref:ComEC/Rec2 family competence protein n=1 Tax=Kocuria oceani TaxID=988827 RepID=UPI00403593C7